MSYQLTAEQETAMVMDRLTNDPDEMILKVGKTVFKRSEVWKLSRWCPRRVQENIDSGYQEVLAPFQINGVEFTPK